jgi:hypothetical protein
MSESKHQPLKQVSDNVSEIDRQFLEAIIRARAGLRFGSIEITVHDGKITQIERKEKFRFQSSPTTTNGSQ